jgi:hypothetical protein
VGSEYFINSQELEDKVRSLLPSQGGAGAGFDLSASTQIIPIIDLTESAQGSNIRQDLQSSLSFNSVTAFSVINTTSTIVSNTGYYRIFGNCIQNTPTASKEASIGITDGVTTKKLIVFQTLSGVTANQYTYTPFDFNIFLEAGDSLSATSDASGIALIGVTRQLADITGELTNP